METSSMVALDYLAAKALSSLHKVETGVFENFAHFRKLALALVAGAGFEPAAFRL